MVTAAALYWELQVVSFPGNGRTVGGGRTTLPKLNWGVLRGREEKERKENMEGFTEKGF